jgi:hypothetical protein
VRVRDKEVLMRVLATVSVGVALLVALPAGHVRGEIVCRLASPHEEYQGYFGSVLSAAGDVNDDGCTDFVLGARWESPGATPDSAGAAYVFAGPTGDTLHTLVSPNAEYQGFFGYAVSGAGDVNNDGYDDVIVGACQEAPGLSPRSAGRAYVFSGQTGDTLHTLVSPNEQANGYFGSSVAAGGDVDGDGYDDVLVGASRLHWPPPFPSGGEGRAYVFSGLTGDSIYTLVSPSGEVGGLFGAAVSGVPDLDNDGYGDLVVGAPLEDPGSSPTDAGRAYVFSGQTGDTLHTLVSPAEDADGYFGMSVSGAGDVNADGCSDVIIGTGCEEPPGAPVNVGRAYVFSGQTGALLYTLTSPNEQSAGAFGWSVSGASDLNNDGHDDVVVGAPGEYPGMSPIHAGRAYTFSGKTGALLHTLASPNQQSPAFFGSSVSWAADLATDGYAGVLIGVPNESEPPGPLYAGRGYVFAWMILSGSLSAAELVLEWTPWPGASAYWVHGADNEAYFEPTIANRVAVVPAGTTTWTSANGVGDPDHNWTYLVVAVDASEQELCRSDRFGEHDFDVGVP